MPVHLAHKEKRRENQSDEPIRGRPGQGPALPHRGVPFWVV